MRTPFAWMIGFMAVAVLHANFPGACQADDWTQFRGTNGGVASGALPTSWGPASNVTWKVRIPGVAWSAPIVLGDRVIVTTAITDNQKKPGGYTPRGGPGGGRGPGGRGGGGGRPEFRPPRPGEILPSFFHGMLNLSEQQKESLSSLQTRVDAQLVDLLSDEQQRQLRGDAQGGGEPGRGGPGGRRGFRPPQPGIVIPDSTQGELKLTAAQKEQLAAIQKAVDGNLADLLTEAQNKQLMDMRQGRRRGGPGGFGERQPPEDIYRWEVHSIDRKTGQTVWKKLALEGRPRIPTQESNTYATETPVSDGERIYAYFAMHGIFCFDMAGDLVWKKDLGSYPMAAGWGTASSPVLDGNRLFVLCDNERESFLVALDKLTGSELWRTPRSEKTSYATPFVWRNNLRTEIITHGSPKVRSYDPETGKQLWELTIGNGRCSASPVGDADMLYVGLDGSRGGPGGGGSGNNASGMFAVRPGASGNLDDDDNDGVAWNARQDGPPMASPLVYDGHVYVFSHNGGIVTCLDAESGVRAYRKRLPGAKSFWASPWAGDGKIYCVDDSGTTFVLKAGPEYELLSQNKLDEMTWASTAAADGSIFVRSVEHLYRISEASDTP